VLHAFTLFWYPFRRGICPHCGERRSVRGPLVELASIAAYVAAWLLIGNDPASLLSAGLYIPFFLAVIVIDIEHRRVLNVMLAPAAVISLGLSLLPGSPSLLQAVIGGVVGFGLFLLIGIIGRGRMGAGDVKLAGVIGLMTGFPDVLIALALGIIAGGLAALALVLTRRAGMKSYIAYAPYLCVGAMVALARLLITG
jgi:leader peptidase (prepilin peptidase)/N-methyltransferase